MAAIMKTKRQMTMSTADICDLYANWDRSAPMETTKPCGTCGLVTPDGTCPDCDTTCGTCGLLTPDGTCPDCAQAARIAAEVGVTVAQVAEVLTWAASTDEGRALTAELDTIEAEARVAA